MGSYLRKNWKKSALVCLLQIVEWGFQAGVQLLLMQVFDKALSLDLKAFLFWSAVDMAAWGGYFLVCYLRESAQARVVRALNNDLRHDLCCQLLQKGYQDYHKQDSGECLSWMTNDVKQIEQLAWNPFFNCVGRASQVLWGIVVLLSLHWSLMAASLVSALIMWALPKLFEKRLEQLGRLCSERQAAGVSALKDLLSGLDVLRFFGQKGRFLRKGGQASDQIEQSSCDLSCGKSAADSAMGFVSVTIQILCDILVILLVLQGKVRMATLVGASNLIACVTNGLHEFANCACRWQRAGLTLKSSQQRGKRQGRCAPCRRCTTRFGWRESPLPTGKSRFCADRILSFRSAKSTLSPAPADAASLPCLKFCSAGCPAMRAKSGWTTLTPGTAPPNSCSSR